MRSYRAPHHPRGPLHQTLSAHQAQRAHLSTPKPPATTPHRPPAPRIARKTPPRANRPHPKDARHTPPTPTRRPLDAGPEASSPKVRITRAAKSPRRTPSPPNPHSWRTLPHLNSEISRIAPRALAARRAARSSPGVKRVLERDPRITRAGPSTLKGSSCAPHPSHHEQPFRLRARDGHVSVFASSFRGCRSKPSRHAPATHAQAYGLQTHPALCP